MLLEVMAALDKGILKPKEQKKGEGAYYPLRFPKDGVILWDQLTACQIHNRIRALTEPYPCAFTYFKGRKVRLLASEEYPQEYYGEPGRVYCKLNRGLLVCALDRCLLVTQAVFADDGTPLYDVVSRYDVLATVREAAMVAYERGAKIK